MERTQQDPKSPEKKTPGQEDEEKIELKLQEDSPLNSKKDLFQKLKF